MAWDRYKSFGQVLGMPSSGAAASYVCIRRMQVIMSMKKKVIKLPRLSRDPSMLFALS